MPSKPAAVACTILLALAGLQANVSAHAQGRQNPAPQVQGRVPADAGGACTITSPFTKEKICMNNVPQPSCDANAREQRTVFEWNAGVDCP